MEMNNGNKTKRRRIIILSGDESVISQIQNSEQAALCKSVILQSEDEEIEIKNAKIRPGRVVQEKVKDHSLICAVCDAPALGFNFDAVSCESCKSFFRRNALKDPPLICARDGNCEITVETRRRCSACRLGKCLEKGMRQDRLILAEQKAMRRRKKQTTIPSQQQNTQLSTVTDRNFFFFTDCLHQNQIEKSNQGLLSFEDLKRIDFIEHLYQNRIELAREGLPWNPSNNAMTFLQKLNSHSVPLIRLLTFFKQIPEFNQLNVDDKVTLIKFNLLPLLCINCTLSYKIETDQIVETDSDVPWDSSVIQEVYGHDGYLQMRKIFESFVAIAQCDQRIIQLALVTLILTKGFSTGHGEMEPVLNDGLAVYRAQNYYVELLWKYIETVHGTEKAVHIWSELITHFITWQTLHKKLRENVERNLLFADKQELLPLIRSLFHFS